MLQIAFSPVYKYQLPEGHRFPMDKYDLLPQQLLHEGLVEEEQFFHPTQLTRSELLLTHSAAYLDKLDQQNLTRKEAVKIGFPMTTALVERGKYIAKGTLDCAYISREQGVALNIAGGTHHSYREHGEGFCVFNDIAIAANVMLDRGDVERVLVVDLDVHQGNGTAKIFEHNSSVFTFSMHGAKNYPGRKEKSDLDIGLPDDTEDEEYLSALKETLPGLIHQVQPQQIFYLSGVDILKSDRLGRLSVSIDGCKERDRYVFEQCREHDIPVAVCMGGGYSPQIRDIIEAHANTFRVAQDIFY